MTRQVHLSLDLSQLGNRTHARKLFGPLSCLYNAVRMACLSPCVSDLASHAVSTGSILLRVFTSGLVRDPDRPEDGKWQMLLSGFNVFDHMLDIAVTLMSLFVDPFKPLVSRSVAVIA